MLPTAIYPLVVPGGGSYRLLVSGQYFKILSATAAVKVQADFGTLDGIIAGQGLENTPFSYLMITNKSGADNTLSIIIGDENFVDGMSGNVAISKGCQAISNAFVNAAATVTTSSSQIIAVNLVRQYLLIQNKDASGNIYISFGTAATVAAGIKIPPGGAFELPGTVSSQAIFAIGDLANNANIVTLEG
jgi:hypothetical protein